MKNKTVKKPNAMKVDLKELFLSLQGDLLQRLETGRKNIHHPGTKGDVSEINWLGMLEKYLPTRYKVEKAFVVDVNGEISEQIDIVVFDRHYSPLLFNLDGATYVPAESVYAVLEVKQSLNNQHIKYAGQKVASVRRLHRTSATIHHAGGTFAPKPLHKILGGILTLDGGWKPALGPSLKKALGSLSESEQLDLGCALQCGSFEATYNEGGTSELNTSKKETALIFFFIRLLHRLQHMATVPAIDLEEYGKHI